MDPIYVSLVPNSIVFGYSIANYGRWITGTFLTLPYDVVRSAERGMDYQNLECKACDMKKPCDKQGLMLEGSSMIGASARGNFKVF